MTFDSTALVLIHRSTFSTAWHILEPDGFYSGGPPDKLLLRFQHVPNVGIFSRVGGCRGGGGHNGGRSWPGPHHFHNRSLCFHLACCGREIFIGNFTRHNRAEALASEGWRRTVSLYRNMGSLTCSVVKTPPEVEKCDARLKLQPNADSGGGRARKEISSGGATLFPHRHRKLYDRWRTLAGHRGPPAAWDVFHLCGIVGINPHIKWSLSASDFNSYHKSETDSLNWSSRLKETQLKY